MLPLFVACALQLRNLPVALQPAHRWIREHPGSAHKWHNKKKAAAQHALSMLSASAQHALSMLSSVIHGGIAAAQHALSVVVDAANPLTRKCTTLSLLPGILPIAASWPLLFPSLLHLLLPLIRNVPLPSLLLPFRWQSPTLQVFPASSLLLLS